MTRYTSDNRLNLKVGVSSFSKDLTSLEVIGRVGINSTTAQNELDVTGSTNITNGLSVGGLSTFTGVGTFGSDLYVDGNLYVKDDVVFDEISARDLNITGLATVGSLKVTTDTEIDRNLLVAGVSTLTGIVTTGSDLYVGGNLFFGNSGGQLVAENLEVTGIASIATLGVSSTTTTKDLVVTGIATIGTSLDVNGPADLVDTVVSGALTATTFHGNGIGLTGITSATNATNIYGGQSGQLLFQAQPGVTSAFYNGSTNQVLASRGVGNPPQWVQAAPSGAIEGLLLFDEGGQVGLGTTYSGLDFRGLDVSVAGGNDGGIATITVVQQTYVDHAGFATAVIGGGASVTSLSNSGITTLTGSLIVNGTTRANNGLNVIGVSTLTGYVGVGSGLNVTGVVTASQYVGDGIRLSGIVTSITAGPNIAISSSAGNVTITGLANTQGLVADSLFVSGISTLGIITGAESLGVGTVYATNFVGGTYSGDGVGLSGIVTSITAGENISISSTTGNVTITGLAKTDRITAESLVVTGVSTLGIVTGLESLGVSTVYSTTIINNDKVGIGTDNPTRKLDVFGNVSFEGDARITGILTLGTSSITLDGVNNIIQVGNGVTLYGNSGIVSATNYYGSGGALSGIVTNIVAGENISIDTSQGQVTITGLANTATVLADSLVVTGVSTLGIITGAESLGVGTVYADNFVGGTFNGSNATFSGNVTIGGTLTYEDVTSVDAVGFVTAREGINVGGGTTSSSSVTDYSEVTLSGLSPSSFNETYTRQSSGFVLDTGTVGSGNALFHADSSYYYYVASTGSSPDSRMLIWSVVDSAWMAVFNFNNTNYTEGNVTNNQALGSSGIFSTTVTATSQTEDGRNVPQASSNIVYSTTGGGSTVSGIGVTILADGNAVFAGIVTAQNLNVVTELTAGSAAFSGNVTIGGTLTYEDVTSVDSVGFVTAQQGINVGGGATDDLVVTNYSIVTLANLSPNSFNETYNRQATGFVLDTGTVASGNALFHADSNYYYYVAATGFQTHSRMSIWSVVDNSWVTVFDFNGTNYTEGNVSDNQAIGFSGIFSDTITGLSTIFDGRNIAQPSTHIVYDSSGSGGTTRGGIGVTILPDGDAIFAGIITSQNLDVTTEFNVGSATSQFNVVSSGSSIMVGIGTTSADYTLDVRGDTNIEGDLTIDGNTVPTIAMVIALGGF